MLKIILQRYICFIGLLTLVSCTQALKESTINKESEKTETSHESLKTTTEAAEDYATFYSRFHSDSLFQMSRIKFPIDGYFSNGAGDEVNWTPSNWIIHRLHIHDADTSVYTVKLTGTATLKKEVLYIEGSGFKIERKFQNINGKWYLVGYIDENL